MKFLACLPHMVWTARPDGSLTSFNPVCFEYFQLEHEDLKDWEWQKIVHPEDLAECLRRWSHALETGDPYEYEFRLRRADGVYRWFLARALPCHDGAGNIVGWVGSCTDIQEKKDVEEHLVAARTELEELFRAFMDDNPAVAWMKDSQGRYVYINETLQRIYQVKADDVLGRTDEDVLPSEVARDLQANDQKVMASGCPVDSLERIPDPEGTVRTWKVWKFPFQSPGGQSFVGGLAFDITDQVEAEAALRRSEAEFRNLVENAGDAIFTLSLEQKFTSLNPAFEEITGWDRAKWLGKKFLPILHPDDRRLSEEVFTKTMRGESTKALELRVINPNGHSVSVELSVVPMTTPENRVVGVLGVGRDVTQRRQLEEQLRQMQRLDSIGRLAAGIAHDFNNILTIQQGYLSSLLNKEELSGEVKQSLGEIAEASERAASLTRQLLLFSRRQVMQPQLLNLNDVIRNLSRMLERILGEDITLIMQYAGEVPPIEADPGMVEQVLMNLVVNARDAMP